MGCGLHENKEAKDGAKMAVNALYASKPRDREEVNLILSKEDKVVCNSKNRIKVKRRSKNKKY